MRCCVSYRHDLLYSVYYLVFFDVTAQDTPERQISIRKND